MRAAATIHRMATIILGLDIGTTSVSGVAIDETGRVQSAVSRTHHASVPDLPDGYAEQDPDCLLSTAIGVLQSLAEAVNPADVKAIGLTGQMHSTVLLDKHQAPIGNVITWQDKRSVAADAGRSATLLEQLHERCPEAALSKSGCRLSPGFLGTTVFALRRLRQWPTTCRSVSFVAGWIASELTGEPAVTDPTHAASSGLVDLTISRWNADLLAAAELNPDWLPRVLPSGRTIGRLTEAMAERTGLQPGTLIGNAVGDNQAAVLSALPEDPGAVLINIGTGGQIVWRTSDFVRVDGMETRCLPALSPADDEQRFMLVGAGLVGGNSLAWLNQTVRRWLAEFGVQRSEAEVWETLQRQMEQTTATDGLTCEPYFSGTRPEPDRRGLFRGISTRNFTPSTVALAILNGIADSMFDVCQRAGEHAPRPLRQVVMAGNASRSNPLLVRAVASRFRVPVRVAEFPEEAATGAAKLAASRLGLLHPPESCSTA